MKLTDDENDSSPYMESKREAKIRMEKDLEDEPYKAKEEEMFNAEAQYESIQKRLDELKGKAEDPLKMTSESDYYKEYEKIIDQMESYGDHVTMDEFREQDDQIRADEIKEFNRLD